MEAKVTTIIFDGLISHKEISAFRGAIMKMFPNEEIYHNHGESGFVYGYPSIQYKILNRKPAIVGICDGAESLERHWKTGDRCSISIHDDVRALTVSDISTSCFSLTKGEYSYSIRNWLPLNQENYKAYKAAESLMEQVALMERTLMGNMLSLYKGMGIWLEEELKAKITEISKTGTIMYKHNELICFDICIRANFPLPANCGLGKGASKGYGTITARQKQ